MPKWIYDCSTCLYQTERNRSGWCEECRREQEAHYVRNREPAVQEALISREALLTDIESEMRFAELKGSAITTMTLLKVMDIINEQKVYGSVNPTEFIFYGADRE